MDGWVEGVGFAVELSGIHQGLVVEGLDVEVDDGSGTHQGLVVLGLDVDVDDVSGTHHGLVVALEDVVDDGTHHGLVVVSLDGGRTVTFGIEPLDIGPGLKGK